MVLFPEPERPVNHSTQPRWIHASLDHKLLDLARPLQRHTLRIRLVRAGVTHNAELCLRVVPTHLQHRVQRWQAHLTHRLATRRTLGEFDRLPHLHRHGGPLHTLFGLRL